MKRYSIAQGVRYFILAFLFPLSVCASDTITITFTGDILLDRGVRKRIEMLGVDHLFTPGIDSIFSASDYVVANLECPATKIRKPVYKRFIFRAEPEWLSALKAHGITHLNLANNHSIDQGREGLIDTRNNIIAAGMTPIGAGDNMQEASTPVMLTKSVVCGGRLLDNVLSDSRHRRESAVCGGRLLERPVYIIASQRLPLENFAYLPNKPCVSQEDFDTLKNRVQSLRRQAPDSYIIVSLHWGWEHTLKPTVMQRHQAHQLIDAGADILICHHSHTLQTIENYHGHPIYYSIGNFIFDQQKPLNTKTCLVQIKITSSSASVETIPVEIRKCVPYLRSAK